VLLLLTKTIKAIKLYY